MDRVMDIVIPHLRGHWNSMDLRYTLRSIAKFYPGHGEVYVMGYKPHWYTGKHWGTAAVRNEVQPFRTTTQMLLEAAEKEELAENFVWWDDDILLLSAYTPTAYHRSRPKQWAPGPYKRAWEAWMARLNNPPTYVPLGPIKDFELHVPMPYRKDMIEHMAPYHDTYPDMLPRSYYGNWRHEDSLPLEDRKFCYYHDPMPTDGIISTGDLFLGTQKARDWADATFPEKSPWEA